MKFKLTPQPNFWDKKTVIKFAWFPIIVENNIIWLEKYEATYRWETDWFWGDYYWNLKNRKLIKHN
jgi:hypothetical protein